MKWFRFRRLTFSRVFATVFLVALVILNFLSTITVASDGILINYHSDTVDSASDNEFRDFPPEEVTNWVISSVISDSDDVCKPSPSLSVEGYTKGSFTTEHANESLYLVYTDDGCNPRYIGSTKIAIGSGSQIITYGDLEGDYRIKKITDINNDGINEILLDSSWLGQGYFNVFNRLIEIRSNGIITLGQFVVYKSNDGALGTRANDVTYDLGYDAHAKVHYSLGENNELASLRSDWVVRGCSDSLPNTVDGCTEFEPLFSYKIPPYQLRNATNFTDEFSKALKRWVKDTCKNVCEVL